MSQNAANNIDARSKNLMDILLKKKYKVKYFQREYKWQKVNVEDLLVDLERSFMSSYKPEDTRDNIPDYDCYYMGPIVLYRDKTSYVIVDGQQRLTTFTLLLIYLKHLQNAILLDTPRKIQDLDEYIYSQPFENESFNLEIPERESVLSDLFHDNKIDESSLENPSSINLLERYNDIVELFPPTLGKQKVLPLFINWVIEKLIFIEILAQTSDSAYTIFESMNDRGLKLTQSELLKSYLLSNVGDDEKIKGLDTAWKKKIAMFKAYSLDEDEYFFKAWLRAKYAQTMRPQERGASNMDFEKIGTRFSNWVQDSSKRLLGLVNSEPDTFYFFVHSDFHFYSDLYLKLSSLEKGNNLPEHIIKLMSYRGIAPSLTYPFILSPVNKIDDEGTIDKKNNVCITFLDSFAVYRMLLNLPITQSSIDNSINKLVIDIRDNDLEKLKNKLELIIKGYKEQFLKETDYISFEPLKSKYILARIFKDINKDIYFDNIYFQRKKDSYTMYQFFTINDVTEDVYSIPKGLKDIFLNNICSYCIIPREIIPSLESKKLVDRIKYLINNKYIYDVSEFKNLTDFFILYNRNLKNKIINIWKVRD